ncbi:MAG TPA: hypothetical protein VFH61_13900 [Thermoleophilia bacterium]|nr:hypothetical protein [Thermoleophilia bacterium]
MMPDETAVSDPPFGQLWECGGCRLLAEWHPADEGGYYAHCSCGRKYGAGLYWRGYEPGYGPEGKIPEEVTTDE